MLSGTPQLFTKFVNSCFTEYELVSWKDRDVKTLKKALQNETISEREIQILNLRFSNNVITSVEAVALQLQVTHQMISKIENQALGKLEEYQKQKGDVKW